MAKCLAIALLLLVVLAYCDGRELTDKDGALAAARGSGAGLGEAKDLGLPSLPGVTGTGTGPTGTSTINGPLVKIPDIPIGRP